MAENSGIGWRRLPRVAEFHFALTPHRRIDMKALQVFVRQFQTQDRGDKIITSLGEIGFRIKESIDGAHDTLGGIIESHITVVDELTTDDIAEILKAVAIHDDVFIQSRRYEMVEESEHRQTGDGSSKLDVLRDDG